MGATTTLKYLLSFLTLVLLPLSVEAARLPGFTIETLGPADGFISSLALRPGDETIYYSTTSGEIYRFDGPASTKIATVPTANVGNAALLGIAFRGPGELIAHYVTPDLTADVIGTLDIETGAQSVLATFLCDGGHTCSSEHHGGNPVVAPDMTIYVGIGDYAGGVIAQAPDHPGGKVFRIRSSEDVEMYALGFRNPFDLAWDLTNGKLLVADNGPDGGDEIHSVGFGDNCGWPFTVGNHKPLDGAVPPIYVFDETVAPTGVAFVRGPLPMPDHGLIVGSFVTSALYYFPDVTERPLRAPVVLIADETEFPIIDVVQDSKGTILFASAKAIHRLHLPMRGDANGNGRIDADDPGCILAEIGDMDGADTVRAAGGDHIASWGADVNVDGVIDARDLAIVTKMIAPVRRRPAAR